jgi:hypothetical protein
MRLEGSIGGSSRFPSVSAIVRSGRPDVATDIAPAIATAAIPFAAMHSSAQTGACDRLVARLSRNSSVDPRSRSAGWL